MRTAGLVVDGKGFGPHDHLCWDYDDPVLLGGAAREFLAEGLELGQRVMYVGGALVAEMQETLDDLVVAAGLTGRGAASVTSLDETYRYDEVVEPEVQVSRYRDATVRALGDGFTGLRVAADATMLVRTREQRSAFARYEHLIDRSMATMPFAAMCAYDRRQLGAAVDELACLHPAVNAPASGFGVYASPDADLALRGDIDVAGNELFRRTLEHVRCSPRGDDLVVDATAVRFIDHRGLLALADHVREAGVRGILRTTAPVLDRLAEILELDGLRVEVTR
jgi:anti-anti-sigma regulatory factor